MAEGVRLYGLPHTELRPGQEAMIKWGLGLKGPGVCQAPTGCHRKGQKVLLYSGALKAVEEVVVGEALMGPDSAPRYVLQLNRGRGPMVRVVPVKGQPFVVNDEHVLTLVRTQDRNEADRASRRMRDHGGEVVDVTVKEWLGWSEYRRHLYKLFRVPVLFPAPTPLPLDPYFLGVLLGDGGLSGVSVCVTTADDPVVAEVYAQARAWGLDVRVQNSDNSGAATTYYFTAGRNGSKRSALLQALYDLGLMGKNSGEKFIPAVYTTASESDRAALLAGLLDTDGSLGSGCYDYVSKSADLAEGVVFVARSLGLAAYVRLCQKRDQNGRGGTYHRVSISGNVAGLPCRLPHKQALPRRQRKDVLRTSFTVERLGVEDYYGFTLDGDGRYLLDDFTVTHNSGKTSLAAALSTQGRVISLVRTKYLQEENYGATYGFDVLYGRGNYDCPHPDNRVGYGRQATAEDCLFPEGMGHCEYARDALCPYFNAREEARASHKASLNYAYFLSARWLRQDPPDYLVCDEAHLLSEIALEWAGCTVNARERDEWDLPPFPFVNQRAPALDTARRDLALRWCERALPGLPSDRAAAGGTPHQKRGVALRRKLENTRNALAAEDRAWFIRSQNQGEAAFVARPLTARYHFPKLFLSGPWHLIAMSATIGNFDTYTAELGLTAYARHDVPSIWPPASRPVYVLDVPEMGRAAGEAQYQAQAEAIVRALQTVPRTWSGLIHVTRKAEASILAARLARLTFDYDRFWVPPDKTGTQAMLAQWQAYKQRHPGAIAVSWAWWEGYDGVDDRICIAAKTPFPMIGDEYELMRMKDNGAMFHQRTAWQLEQALGRTRRGNKDDYDSPGEQRGLVAIADGSWHRVRNYLSTAMRESLVLP